LFLWISIIHAISQSYPLTYSLPSKPHSTQRVALWRRLRRLGAVSLTGSVYFLPDREECVEAFQWLVREIREAQGEAFAFTIERLEGVGHAQIVELFNTARKKEYEEIEAQAVELENSVADSLSASDLLQVKEAVDRLRRAYAEVLRIDYFRCPEGVRAGERLARIERELSPEPAAPVEVMPVSKADYQGKHWVTRPRPHVDRLACAWLIRRFIDPKATIRYTLAPEPDEIAFDMNEGPFGHQGNLCTFEVMVIAFELDTPGLHKMAEIVHEIDLRDGRYSHPETTGIDALLQGWLLTDMPDPELESHGCALFEGLYATFSQQ
jgi:hypothetical protein